MKKPISITAVSSISALGSNQNEIWSHYLSDAHFIKSKQIGTIKAFVASISEESKKEIATLRKSDSKYKNLDDTVLYAIYTSRKVIEKAGWESSGNFGVNIGSSRGATVLFEKLHQSFLKFSVAETLTSPTTTLGNISSWVAHDLKTAGPEISHSITCSTALHSLLNGVAWIQAGMSDKFLVGGSEAALTDFTIAQMQAMKIYARESNLNDEQNQSSKFPCKAFDLNKKQNTMVIGEGASMICLEAGVSENAIAMIEGVGYATEVLEHNISISTEALCFQKSMRMALRNTNLDEIDAIVMHAPGTIKGDLSEFKAISTIFCNKTPFLTTNKWKLGHTFGASGMLSVELAILMLENQQSISVPFAMKQNHPKRIEKVLVNAVGFGGNAVSVLLTKKL
ncbi:MAG: beta-ketoacyl synthase [Flavobacteriaceae bacterium]